MNVSKLACTGTVFPMLSRKVCEKSVLFVCEKAFCVTDFYIRLSPIYQYSTRGLLYLPSTRDQILIDYWFGSWVSRLYINSGTPGGGVRCVSVWFEDYNGVRYRPSPPVCCLYYLFCYVQYGYALHHAAVMWYICISMYYFIDPCSNNRCLIVSGGTLVLICSRKFDLFVVVLVPVFWTSRHLRVPVSPSRHMTIL